MDVSKLGLDYDDEGGLTRQEKKRHKVRSRIVRDRMREKAFSKAAPMNALFETDEDFKLTIGTYPLVSGWWMTIV